MTAQIREFLALYPQQTRRWVTIGVVCSVLLGAVEFFSMLLIFPVFGSLAGGGSNAVSMPLGAGWDPRTLVTVAMAIMIARTLLSYAFRYWWTLKVSQSELALSARLMHDLAYAPYSFHLAHNSQDLLARAVSHVNMATGAGLSSLVLMVGDTALGVALIGAVVGASPTTSFVVLGFVAVVATLVALGGRRQVRKLSVELGDQIPLVYRMGSNLLRGVRELAVAGARDDALVRVASAREGMVGLQRQITLLGERPRVILDSSLYLGILVALSLVLASGDSAQMLAVIALYVLVAMRILPVVSRLLASLVQLRTGLEMGGQISTQLAVLETVGADQRVPAGDLPSVGDLAFEGVSFAYREGEPVLADVSVRIPWGHHVGLIGPSGSGKSTLLGLALGFLKPDSGRVTFGGASVGVADPSWLHKVAYLPQDCYVLDDTVIANVALGSEVDEGRAWEALHAAALDDVIRSMDHGLDASVGENGSRLSVGQRQRLGLARALYRRPAVLILDEPTAALDAATEAEIVETVSAMRGSLTIVTVAHRTATLAACDAVYEIQDGRLELTTLAV